MLLPRRCTGALDIRLLGPVELVSDGAPIRIGGAQVRTVLAVLAMHAGRVVDAGALTEAVWGDSPPRTAGHALHVYISALRKALGDDGWRVAARPPGYVLHLDPGSLDIDRFELTARDARMELASGRPEPALRLLADALAQWRGRPLLDVPWERFADPEVRQLEERRLAAEEDRAEALLECDDAAAAVAEAEALVAAEPLRDRRWALLLQGLHASGRQAEALRRFQDLRRFLGEELGLEPSRSLVDLDARIARDDPTEQAPPVDDADEADPVTRFVRLGGAHIAYQTLGAGPTDLVFIPGLTGHLELRWEDPDLARLFRRLARSCRLILFDKRGTGMSDRDAGMPAVEDQVDDVLAVMDAAVSSRAVLFGVLDGAAIAILTAAAHPERVAGVITWTAFPVFAAPDYPYGASAELLQTMQRILDEGLVTDDAIPAWAPSRVGDTGFARRLNRLLRMGAGLGGMAAILRRIRELDIRPMLSDVAVPVLLLHREGDRILDAENARWLAARLPDARFVLLPGEDNVIWAGDVDAIAEQVEAFVRTVE